VQSARYFLKRGYSTAGLDVHCVVTKTFPVEQFAQRLTEFGGAPEATLLEVFFGPCGHVRVSVIPLSQPGLIPHSPKVCDH
jgi:hypothetical protein